MSRRHDESKTAPDPWGVGWGEYATFANLPNSSGAAVTSSDLLRKGDHATVGGFRVVCQDPTPSAAVWYYSDPPTGSAWVFNVPINANAANLAGIGTDAAVDAATSLYYTEIFVPRRMTLTGAAVLNGTTVGTDNIRTLLFDSDGAFIIGSATAGVLGAGADVFQAVAFTAATTVSPGRYFVGYKANGTTHQTQKLSAGSAMVICEKETGHTFAGNDDITSVATTFTADVAPIVRLY